MVALSPMLHGNDCMKPISAFGLALVPEFRGDFSSATTRVNVGLSKKMQAIQPVHVGVMSEVGWTTVSTGGPRAIFVRYASMQESPCELLVNGAVVQSRACFERTETIKLIDIRFQTVAELVEGQNEIAIRSQGRLPEIHELIVTDVPDADLTPVDTYHALLTAEREDVDPKRPFVLSPDQFRGMISTMRSVVTDDAAVRTLSAVVAQAILHGRDSTQNGQAAIPWGGPLNGQRYRQQIFARLMRVGVDAIIETGTYVGASTCFFSRQGVPVHTCESQIEFFATALANLADCSNVKMYLQDSRAFLKYLSQDESIDYKCPLFYLDAHWYNDLPLADEIKTIRQRWPTFVIMVDDFEVPGQPYGFDRYENGLELTLNYLSENGVDTGSMAVMFPTAAHTAETGVRRGTLILSSLDIYDAHLRHERTVYRHRFDGPDIEAGPRNPA
jgi:predicted O-methyltransferase YrrM